MSSSYKPLKVPQELRPIEKHVLDKVAYMRLLTRLSKELSFGQLHVLTLLEEGYTQVEIAEYLEVAPQNISQTVIKLRKKTDRILKTLV
jgi:DNA-binding MarR family transcriptional regulator